MIFFIISLYDNSRHLGLVYGFITGLSRHKLPDFTDKKAKANRHVVLHMSHNYDKISSIENWLYNTWLTVG